MSQGFDEAFVARILLSSFTFGLHASKLCRTMLLRQGIGYSGEQL